MLPYPLFNVLRLTLGFLYSAALCCARTWWSWTPETQNLGGANAYRGATQSMPSINMSEKCCKGCMCNTVVDSKNASVYVLA
eukprot:2708797-Amphidinium_carterae.1